jgi:hypothetical protein
MRRLATPTGPCALLLALLLAPAARAQQAGPEPHPRRGYAGIALGAGTGAAAVKGARLEFGPPAVAFSLRGGLILSPAFLLGLQLDAVGSSSGRVVPLGACVPGYACPATTEHRVAVNHWSVVGTWLPGADVLVRAGGGLAESFTEDWGAPGAAVVRSFGWGLVGGLAWAPAVSGRLRVSANLDGLAGWYGSQTSWAGMLSVGLEYL